MEYGVTRDATFITERVTCKSTTTEGDAVVNLEYEMKNQNDAPMANGTAKVALPNG